MVLSVKEGFALLLFFYDINETQNKNKINQILIVWNFRFLKDVKRG